MSDSVYKVVQLVGSSSTSWEEAAGNAVKAAGKSLRDLRIAEVDKLDLKVGEGDAIVFRTRLNLSFKVKSG
ncbi:MAG: dodecin family protein [Candidatus Neomarinimicrobiota bacterium]